MPMPSTSTATATPGLFGRLQSPFKPLSRGGPPKPPGGQPPDDPYANTEALLQFFKDCKEEAFEGRAVFERLWWRNILYVLGRQWIYYDTGRNQWQDKRLARWIPRPVTNKTSEGLQAIRALFESVELGVSCRPNGERPEDMSTAEAADRYARPLMEEHEIDARFGEGDFWLIATGNVFYHPRYDKRGDHGTIKIPLEQCISCGLVSSPSQIMQAGNTCPSCKSPEIQPAFDEATQEPLYKTVNRGKGVTDVVSVLEIAGPTGYTRADEWPFLIRMRWRARHWWKKNHPELEKELRFDKMPAERSLQLLKAIPSASEIGTQPITYEGGGGDGALVEGLTEYELWVKPCNAYPKGLFLRVVGEKGQERILELPDEPTKGPLPYTSEDGTPLWNWVHVPYELIGGRVWGRSPLDAIISKQDQLNQLDSLTILIVNRVANPVWLEPRGSDVKKFTGEPGLVVKWNPLVGVSAKPERIEGQNVPSSIFQIRQQIIDDIEAALGTYDVIKGAKPTGVEAFSALNLLVERSQSRFTPVLKARGRGFREWFTNALELERAYGPYERVEAVMGPNATWTFQHFKVADLKGNITVTIEDGSHAPKTNLGDRAAIEQLRNFGVINPAMDPDQQYVILKKFGQTQLMPGLDVHVRTALREQSEWEKWAATVQAIDQPTMGPVDPATGMPGPMMMTKVPVTPPPGMRKKWHADPVHISQHVKWLNSDTVTKLLSEKPWLEPYATQFLEQHEQAMMAAQLQQQVMAGAPADAGPGVGGEAGGGGNALSSSNRESGNTGDVPSGNGQRADNRGPS